MIAVFWAAKSCGKHKQLSLKFPSNFLWYGYAIDIKVSVIALCLIYVVFVLITGVYQALIYVFVIAIVMAYYQ